MDVHMYIETRARPVHARDGAGLDRGGRVARGLRPLSTATEQRLPEDPRQRRQHLGAGRSEPRKLVREGQNVLPDGRRGEHAVHQMGCRACHSAAGATRAEATHLAREGDGQVVAARRALDVDEPAAKSPHARMDSSQCALDAQCSGASCQSSMPKDDGPLEVATRDIVRRWIAQGAKNDGPQLRVRGPARRGARRRFAVRCGHPDPKPLPLPARQPSRSDHLLVLTSGMESGVLGMILVAVVVVGGGIAVKLLGTKAVLPQLPPFGPMPLQDLPKYLATQEPAIAWEAVRGWQLNESPPRLDAPGSIQHIVLTPRVLDFCSTPGGRLALSFNFLVAMIEGVDFQQNIPPGIAPPGHGVVTISTPSGRTLLVGSPALAQAIDQAVRRARG